MHSAVKRRLATCSTTLLVTSVLAVLVTAFTIAILAFLDGNTSWPVLLLAGVFVLMVFVIAPLLIFLSWRRYKRLQVEQGTLQGRVEYSPELNARSLEFLVDLLFFR